MKYSRELALLLLSLFFVFQLFILFVGNLSQEKGLPFGLQAPELSELQAPPYLLGGVLIVTLIVCFFITIKLIPILLLFYFLTIAICISVTFSYFVESWAAVLLGIGLAIVKIKERGRDIYFHNFTELLCYAGAACILAQLFPSVLAVFILFILLSIYDVIAVRVTKHMIPLVRTQISLGATGIIYAKWGDEIALLGGGDIVFPSILAILASGQSWISALFAIYGALLGLSLLIHLGKREKIYPAMPFVCFPSFILYFLGLRL